MLALHIKFQLHLQQQLKRKHFVIINGVLLEDNVYMMEHQIVKQLLHVKKLFHQPIKMIVMTNQDHLVVFLLHLVVLLLRQLVLDMMLPESLEPQQQQIKLLFVQN